LSTSLGGVISTVEVLVEFGPFLAGGVAVFLDGAQLAPLVEEGDVVADDVFVKDGDVAAGGAEAGCCSASS
jgi:hypothetical protein